ncbi:MAG: restriction endonuclease subunit S, partial [Lentisphaeria bacterium]
MTAKLTSYPEYKESSLPWLGKVPKNWDLKPGVAAFASKQVKNIGLREKTVLSLSYGRIVVKPQEKLHGLVPESFETYQIVEPGDIIIRGTDLQNDKRSLRIGLSRNHGIITSAYICLKPGPIVSSEYAYQILNVYDL